MPKRNETLKFSTSFLGTNRASAQTTIVDTSYPSTYNTKWSNNSNGTDTITSVNEGNDAWLIINTDNVPNGTTVRVMVNATGLGVGAAVAADFTNWAYSQDVIINNGFASIRVGIKADDLTEGTETFSCAVLDINGTVLSTAYLTINDTSLTPLPTYVAEWYSSSAGTTPITTINEGSTAWLIVKTTQIRDNHGLGVKFTGAGITYDDLVPPAATAQLTSAVNIVGGIGRQAVTITADNLTEGNELLTASIYDGDIFKTSTAITIVDTSIKLLIINGPAFATETYANKTITVINSINLYDFFVSNNGRAPYAGEIVNFIVNNNIAIVGPTSGWAVTMDPRWNDGQVVSIENSGYILGRGGNAENRYMTGYGYGADSTLPGGGVNNTSSIPLTIRNHSGAVIAGGGGYGGSAAVYGMRGAGGAPYGKGGLNYRDGGIYYNDRYGNLAGTDATFDTGGAGGVYNHINYGGNGGTWNTAGSTARYDRHWVGGSAAGPVSSGNVTIVSV